MIKGRVDDSEFMEWVGEVRNNFHSMVKTMEKVARIIELTTVPYVPLDTSALEQSFDYDVLDSSPFIILGVGYDAVDEESGFHYAEYQHEHHFNHPKRGIPYYLTVGIHDAKYEFMEIIESDYLSLFYGAKISSISIGEHNKAKFIKYSNM